MVRRNVGPATFLATFSRPFPKLDFWMHFGRPLAHHWLPFGSPWPPFGSLWFPFGSLWLPFGSLWLPFGLLLVPFGSLLLTRGVHFLTFAVSWPLFWYFSIFSSKISCKIIFLNNSHRKSILNQSNRIFPKSAERTPTESISSLIPHP